VTTRRVLGAALLLSLAPLVGGRAQGGDSPPRRPVIQERVRLAPDEPVGFRVLITPDTVFVGQQATYEIGVFISESAQQRMRRNPEVVPGELRGVLAYDLGGPQSLPAITQNGQRSFPHVLQRALFPLAPGRLEIPASTLSYSLPRSASFFSREETAVLRAADLPLVVKPLPTAGQPADFSGAVGRLAVTAQLDATEARVGEPAVLTVRVSGRGNVKLWPRPRVAMREATLVEAGERVRADTSGQFVHGVKEFDWLLTPERAGPLRLPVVTYSYFDPYSADYRVATSDSLRLVVATGEVIPGSVGTLEEPGLDLRRRDRGSVPRPWSEQPLVWALAALAPLPAFWRGARRRRTRQRLALAAAPTVATAHVPPDEPPATRARREAAAARRRLLDALAAQLATTAPTLVERAAIERRLRRRGVTRETTADVLHCLDTLDAIAWAPDAPTPEVQAVAGLDATIEALLARVADEAIPGAAAPPRSRDTVRGTAMLVLLGAGALLEPALVPTRERALLHAGAAQLSAFEDALAAFDAQRFSEAADRFVAIARDRPRHADAWANAGTAAWAAGDTVLAVRGWQQALRLEPDARDVRAHLAQLPSASWSGVAAVAEGPVEAGTALALLAWGLLWLLAAGIRWRGRPDLPARERRLAIAGLLVVAGAALGWQWRADRARAGETLYIVQAGEPMRVAPGRDANVFGGTTRGDVVEWREDRLDGAGGEAWAHVRHADGRDGWLPARALVPLHDRGARRAMEGG
jgi:tetratricopeptide (TPR) repeat protein